MKRNLNLIFTKFLFALLILVIFAPSCKKDTVRTNTNEVKLLQSGLLTKKYTEVCFLMTHNSMNTAEHNFYWPNQTLSTTHQLERGVRGFMYDTFDDTSGICKTYHISSFFGSRNLADELKEIKLFLDLYPNEIVSIIFQNEGGNTQLQAAIDSAGLTGMAFVYTGTWPTLQEMVASNKRMVMFVEKNKTPRAPYLMYAWSLVFDTPYTFKTISEFNCNLNRGGSGSKDLFLVNHWLGNFWNLPDSGLAYYANKRAVLGHRVQDCSQKRNHFINYLGVDFVHIGDAMAIVDSINGY